MKNKIKRAFAAVGIVADLFGEYLRQYEIKPKIRYKKEL